MQRIRYELTRDELERTQGELKRLKAEVETLERWRTEGEAIREHKVRLNAMDLARIPAVVSWS